VDEGEQLIRDVWRRWNEGEREPDAMEIDPGIEVHSALAKNVYSGRDGVMAWVGEIDEQFESWALGIDELRPLAPGSYIVHGSIHARGRTSGLDLDQPASWLVDVRDGRLLRIRNFIGAMAREAAEGAAPIE
jgi:ketosteroid isomerase-like protein